MAIDEGKLQAFVEKALGDLGAALATGLVAIGDKLGLYKALAAHGPLTSTELASRTGTAERYVREWLAAQAAAGYVGYDAASRRYGMSAEQIEALTNEQSPACVLGGFQSLTAAMRAQAKIIEGFRSGRGVGWHEHEPDLFEGTRRFFQPGYAAHLVAEWIPALEGVTDKLTKGARVADVGCGFGASTMLMARAFPRSEFVGFDYHAPSIERARELANAAGGGQVRFEVAAAKEFPGTRYDLVTFFDCLHDMGDPVGAAAHVLQSLAADGTWMIVEPFAHDRVEDNIRSPLAPIFYGASTYVCTPASLSQEVGLALGAQAGEARLREVAMQGGFRRFRRATETPINLVLEARP
jgi:SAM-dependent methyltransferase